MSASAATAETYTVTPIKSLDGTVTLPGSKSLSNRCLLLAALSEGNTKVDNLLESDDIRYMLQALDQMQVPVERHSAESVTVTGQSGPINSPNPEEACELFLGNAGTAMRPLAAALCMGKGKFVLDGVPRMRERPIADLIDGLQQLGADVTCVKETGCPPVTINANGLAGGKVCRYWMHLPPIRCSVCHAPNFSSFTSCCCCSPPSFVSFFFFPKTNFSPNRRRLVEKCLHNFFPRC